MIRSRRNRVGVAVLLTGLIAALIPATPATATSVHRAPHPRTSAGMAQDVTGGVVLFGGLEFNNALGDTWRWDGSGWTDLHPAHSPSPRFQMGMAYDAANGQVVLFGGRVGSEGLGDTWTWDGADWTKQHPAHSPPPLAGPELAYDATRQQIVLFGGWPDVTWTWGGTDWTERHPADSPLNRTGFGMATDPLCGVVLFGGDDGDDFLGDTWKWDGTDWTPRSPAHSPKARSGMGMALDETDGQVVVFAGRRFNDTWTWDGTDWTKRAPVNPPYQRTGLGMASDPVDGGILQFGPSGDTWTWDGSDWTEHPEASVKLEGRSGPPGSGTIVSGWGFLAREDVKISFLDSVHGKILLLTVQADPSGTFERVVTIPNNATQGKQHILVKGVSSHQSAQVGYKVT